MSQTSSVPFLLFIILSPFYFIPGHFWWSHFHRIFFVYTTYFSFSSMLMIFFLSFRFYLFIFRERREGERERNINMWLSLACPLLGTWPKTQACAVTGNWTSDPLVYVLNPLSHTSQGSNVLFFVFLNSIFCSPGWCGSVDCMLSCKPKGHWFDSQSGHMPGL